MDTTIPRHLLEEIRNGNVIPFIGTGVSCLFGYPTWSELLSDLIEELMIPVKIDDIKDKDPLQVAEAIWRNYEKSNFDKAVEEIRIKYFDGKDNLEPEFAEFVDLRVKEKLSNDFNEVIAKCVKKDISKRRAIRNTTDEELKKLKLLNEFGFKNIVTTNYDNVLEKEIFGNLNIVYPGRGKELEGKQYNNTIYKIHGDMNDPVGIVLTHSQYHDFIKSQEYFKSKLYDFFTTSTILMMGYTFRDINIHQVYFQYWKDYGNMLKKVRKDQSSAYMVIREHEAKGLGSYYIMYKDYLEGFGIQIIECGDLCNFVEKLHSSKSEYVNNLKLEQVIRNEDKSQVIIIIYRIIKGEKIDIKPDFDDDILRCVAHIITYPIILRNEPFEPTSLDEETQNIETEAGKHLYEAVKEIIKERPDNKNTEEYYELILSALEFANNAREKLNNFYYYPERFNIFIDLSTGVKDFQLSSSKKKRFAELFGSMLRYSGDEIGYCKGSEKLLKQRFHDLPEEMINIYIDSIEQKVKEVEEEASKGEVIYASVMGNREIEWLKKFIGLGFQDDKIKERIERLISEVEGKHLYYF